MALNFTPCEDSGKNGNDQKVEISQIENFVQEQCNIDLCSPFCQCHCCQIYSTCFNLEDFIVVTQKISTDVFLHSNGLGKDITTSILQPPRV